MVRSAERSADYGQLQEFVDYLYRFDEDALLKRLEIVSAAETYELNDDLAEIVRLLPPGTYNRLKLCLQMNSALSSHDWGYVYGTVS